MAKIQDKYIVFAEDKAEYIEVQRICINQGISWISGSNKIDDEPLYFRLVIEKSEGSLKILSGSDLVIFGGMHLDEYITIKSSDFIEKFGDGSFKFDYYCAGCGEVISDNDIKDAPRLEVQYDLSGIHQLKGYVYKASKEGYSRLIFHKECYKKCVVGDEISLLEINNKTTC